MIPFFVAAVHEAPARDEACSPCPNVGSGTGSAERADGDGARCTFSFTISPERRTYEGGGTARGDAAGEDAARRDAARRDAAGVLTDDELFFSAFSIVVSGDLTELLAETCFCSFDFSRTLWLIAFCLAISICERFCLDRLYL